MSKWTPAVDLDAAAPHAPPHQVPVGVPAGVIFAGLCATLLGVGLQRFAYAPLLPAMVQQHWLSAGPAGALAAVNLAGYLGGAAIAPGIARAFGLRITLRMAMLAATLAFALCAINWGVAWLVAWRAIAGAAGGLLMVLGGPAVQASVPARMRGLASGLMFTGIGIGIIGGAILVPALLGVGLPAAWLALSVTAAVLTVLSWRLWPVTAVSRPAGRPRLRGPAGRLAAVYLLGAIAAAPHMIWWPDFIARGLDRGATLAALLWALYGLSVAVGPTLFSRLAGRIGTANAFAATLVIQIIGLLLPIVLRSTPWLVVSVIAAGIVAIGQTALALTRTREVAGDGAPEVWRIITAGYGAAQASIGFVLAWLHEATGSHVPLFAVGLLAAVVALPLATAGGQRSGH
jgi:MFS family permease